MPGFPSPPAINNYVNLVHANYVNSVRAGYSYVIADILTTSTNEGFRDAADDNLNAFDPYPPGHTGELNDQDYYDAAGALILPVDRMRRYVTPGDINGTGSVVTLDRTPRPRGPTPLAGSTSTATIVPPAHPDRSPRRRARRARRPLPQPLAPSARSIIRRTQPATTSSIRTGRTTTRFRQPRALHWPIRHTFPT